MLIWTGGPGFVVELWVPRPSFWKGGAFEVVPTNCFRARNEANMSLPVLAQLTSPYGSIIQKPRR